MSHLRSSWTQPPIMETSLQVPGQQPSPAYFISRSNGNLVPLIPADELPYNVRLQGISRVVRFDQTVGMQHVGTAAYTGATYNIETDRLGFATPLATHTRSQHSTSTKQYLAPDALARQSLPQFTATTDAAGGLPQRYLASHEAATSWRKASTSQPTACDSGDKTQSLIDAIINSTASAAAEAARIGYVPKSTATPPSGSVPNQDKKQFCTYWIRHGVCDYIQQGCFYKHEMPDKATLEQICGMRSYPRWWVEKNGGLKLFSGERAHVGPIIRATDWLKVKGRKVDDDDDESTISATASNSGVPKSIPVDEQTKPAVEIDEKKLTIRKAAAPAAIDIRKASTASDLIDFAPLLPTPSPTTPSLTPSSSTSSSPRQGQTTPSTPTDSATPEDSHPHTKTETTLVFVPAGESAEHHIADVKKRHRAPRSTPTSALRHTAPIDRQIRDLQRSKHQQGLLASKHAPAVANGEHDWRKNTKGAGRVRRPASATPVAAPGKAFPSSCKSNS